VQTLKPPKIAPEILANADWSAAVGQATEVLEQEIGNAAGRVTTEWSLIRHPVGHPGFRLRVVDEYGGEAESAFALDELRNTPHLHNRLHWLWGDVLQDTSHKQLERLKQVVQQLEDD
jgi:hypothetical protein